jgi:chloramphenicol-sensitive protein RarD
MRSATESPYPSGVPMALGAHLIWGLLPLYLILVRQVPPFEFVGWRVIFTVPVCLLFIALRSQMPDLRAALANRKVLRNLFISAVLVGANWLIYIAAIQAGHIFAASLGYYIIPLVNVLSGTAFLGERLSPRQWWAVALAGVGVAILAWGALDMLWISLSLAFTFSTYGLIRKITPVGSLPGLTIESALLLLPGIGIVLWYAQTPAGMSIGRDIGSSLLIAGSGVVTAVPLLMFAIAARRMDYSILGFFQYISPNIVFLLGLFVFHEPLRPVQLASFIVIWCAVALFVWDLLARRRG